MRFDEIIIRIAAFGILLGAMDRILGGKLGLGKQFEEGLNTMGPLAVTMAGLICLSPVIANVIGPSVAAVFRAIGCDPALFGALLPNDTGGYPLAMALADDELAGKYAGLIIASMFGCTLTFTLPLGMNMLEKRDLPYFAYGSLIGLICVPFGSALGGVLAGCGVRVVLLNTIPVAALSALFAVGLKLIPTAMMKFCQGLGRIVNGVATIGLAAAGFESLSGIVLIPGMTGVDEALRIVGSIGVVLMGMFPILTLFIKLLKKPLGKIGNKFGLDALSSAGLLITLCNSLSVVQSLKDMNSRGKIYNSAFFVCASAALGAHLGFTASAEPTYVPAMIAGKIFGGVLSVMLCVFFARDASALDQESASIVQSEA